MLNILLVDDEPASAEYLASIVGKYLPDARIAGIAEDGLGALEILKTKACDVIISDICMPRMDGLALARAVHENRPEIGMVIVSGFEKFEYAKAAMRYGVRDYLLKPVMPAELTECLNRLIAAQPGETGTAGEEAGDGDDFTLIRNYIEDHLSDALSLSKVSAALGMSQASLMRALRTCADMTFVEYVTVRRIEQAKALIARDPRCRLKAVAARVGFSDALYFSRVFRQHTGHPPSEYAKMQKKENM